MKIPPLLLAPLRRGAFLGLLALGAGHAACSSNEPPELVQQRDPSLPQGPAAPGALGGDPSTVDTSGLPDPAPVSAPPENDGPGATETNFLRPPCRTDSNCPAGLRCIIDARTARAPDAGGSADAGDAGDPGDAGQAGDAGGVLGRCELPDPG